jgi:hypothetical protein
MNPKNSETRMGKEKIALAVCFCLIVALAGFSTWLYVRANGLESKVNDLESKTSSLEAQNTELSEQVQNLTDWRDAFMNGLNNITFMKTEQLTILSVTWETNNAIFIVKNTGTANLTIVEAKIDSVTATMNPSSVTLSSGSSETLTITKTEGFISGIKYEFEFITVTGNHYFFAATAP